MIKILVATAAGALALGLAGCASQTHSAGMLEGSHPMAPHGVMADKAMPSKSADCMPGALANMPADHRAMCEGRAKAN